ncbi:hypothetical protein VNO77_22763 [Canavalia gladiata]|uniref:Uncharacterized protein n=1 Tax=Canavalia gladiata TaxID=3824 RepID=A0AAN9L3P6_CANGL
MSDPKNAKLFSTRIKTRLAIVVVVNLRDVNFYIKVDDDVYTVVSLFMLPIRSRLEHENPFFSTNGLVQDEDGTTYLVVSLASKKAGTGHVSIEVVDIRKFWVEVAITSEWHSPGVSGYPTPNTSALRIILDWVCFLVSDSNGRLGLQVFLLKFSLVLIWSKQWIRPCRIHANPTCPENIGLNLIVSAIYPTRRLA